MTRSKLKITCRPTLTSRVLNKHSKTSNPSNRRYLTRTHIYLYNGNHLSTKLSCVGRCRYVFSLHCSHSAVYCW